MKYNDPFRKILNITEQMYGKLKVKIVFPDKMPEGYGNCCGECEYDEDLKIYYIYINKKRSISEAEDTLCHELAHVIDEYEKRKYCHNKVWRKYYKAILAAYELIKGE